MDSVAGKQMEIYYSDIESLIASYNNEFNEKLDSKDIIFPDFMKETLPEIYHKLHPGQDDSRMIVERYVRSLNERKLK